MWHRVISVALSNLIPLRSFSVHHRTGSSVLFQLLPKWIVNETPWLSNTYLSRKILKGLYSIQKTLLNNAVRRLYLLSQHWSISGLGVTRTESDRKKKQTAMSRTCTTFNKPLYILPDNCKYFTHLFSLRALCSDFRERHHSPSFL